MKINKGKKLIQLKKLKWLFVIQWESILPSVAYRANLRAMFSAGFQVYFPQCQQTFIDLYYLAHLLASSLWESISKSRNCIIVVLQKSACSFTKLERLYDHKKIWKQQMWGHVKVLLGVVLGCCWKYLFFEKISMAFRRI